MSKQTRATQMLQRKAVAFSVHGYDYDPKAALQAVGGKAAALVV
ncbi:MAG: hypothetical protein JWR00_2840 [Rubritepida sp.]|nr:hypothetical protein [Rubritepida sp.]